MRRDAKVPIVAATRAVARVRFRHGVAGRRGVSTFARGLAVAALLAMLPQVATATDTDDQQISEISLLAGSISSQSDWPKSYAWAFSYRHVWQDYFSTTVSYLNQGHFPGHHRDGVTAEAWAQTDLFDRHLTLAVGAGPFNYYDTTAASHGGTYSDAHGWAWLYSASATWQPRKHGWFAELRLDRTAPAKSIETTSVSAGLGYRLTPDLHGPSPGVDPVYHQKEFTAFYGKTVVNSFNSQEAAAKALEFRYAFGDYLRGSAGYVNEGNAQLIRRNGMLLEGWLEPGFSAGRYSVGVGAGAYAAIDKYQPAPGRHVSGVVTLTMSFRLLEHLDARFNWHRIVTNYNRDTDIALYQLGYRWK